MPPAKRTEAESKTQAAPQATCDNHPDRPAAHTTSAVLHQAISLCKECLAKAEHLLHR